MTRFALLFCCAVGLAAEDTDRDGLADRQEQELLNRFAPRFFVDAKDCDVLPSTIEASRAEPRAVAANGQIYGQAFPAGKGAIELHYYHLWRRDCGRKGHPLDAEHVAARITASAPDAAVEQWKAVYWFASAHQNTLCDISHAAPAAFLHAENAGPPVWISSGKHGSFLSMEACSGGCGSDRCGTMVPLLPLPIVNIGERGAPMNGASWIASTAWPLASKMGTDFPAEQVIELERARGIVLMKPAGGAVRGTIAVANVPVDAVSTGSDHTGAAIGTAQRKTTGSLGRAGRAVWDRLKKISD